MHWVEILKIIEFFGEKERLSVSIRFFFSPFYIGDGWLLVAWLSATPPYFATRLY